MDLTNWFRTNENDAIRQSFQRGEALGESRGVTRGVAHGLVQGVAQSVLKVLAKRGLAVSQQERERILACEDAPTLDRWLDLALTAATTAEVLGG